MCTGCTPDLLQELTKNGEMSYIVNVFGPVSVSVGWSKHQVNWLNCTVILLGWFHFHPLREFAVYSLCSVCRRCIENKAQQRQECVLDQWEGNWTLVARNPLGQHILTDIAELRNRGWCITLTLSKLINFYAHFQLRHNIHQPRHYIDYYYTFWFIDLMSFHPFSSVHPVAPANLDIVVNAWNATVLWQWEYNSYSSLALVCQVEVTSPDSRTEVRLSLCVGITE